VDRDNDMTVNRGILPVLVLAALAGCSEPGNGGGERVPTGSGVSAGADAAVIDSTVRELAAAYTRAWNSDEPAEVAAFYAPDGVLTINDGEPAAGRDAVEAVAADFMSAFPDLELVNDRLEVAGERINYHWTFRGTNSGPGGTGNAVDFSGYESWILNGDGLIQDSLGNFDVAEYEAQRFAQPAELTELGLEFFPADHSLARAEDGIAMADGSLLVVDQVHGLRRLFADGSSEPFGQMPQVGYRHDPSGLHGGANGMSLEPGGTHVLVADIFGGGLYRVALADGQSSKIYQHRYGINVAVRDSSGAIWFTQSAHNPADQGEALMWAAVDAPLPQGALLRIGTRDGRLATEAEVIEDGLLFANGLAIDEERGVLYLAETTGMRVTRYELDVVAGSIATPEVVVEGVVPDNIEIDARGRLWVGAPLPNTMLIYDPDTESVVSLLPEATDARQALQEEWVRLGEVGETRMALLGPHAWRPFSGFVTGVIHGAPDGNVYLTGLSNTLVKVPLERMP